MRKDSDMSLCLDGSVALAGTAACLTLLYHQEHEAFCTVACCTIFLEA